MSDLDIQTKYQSVITKLFQTEDKIAYAEILLDEKRQIFPIYSREMDSLITRLIYEEIGKPPSKKIKENFQSALVVNPHSGVRV
ncbi:MAG: hypothetical protein IPJ01_13695 [Micavibrio sp.]|nr:hypothetical protein [Micavibrio sp.]MBK9562999.1 hypothetical protein [Micavibrio sp.]